MQAKKKNTKQKQKGGVSLIVLVITVIVMVILAAAVVVTLNNTGILDKANTAVYNTNKAEVHTVVQLLALNGNGTIDGTKLQEEVAKMGGTCVPNSMGGWNVTVKNYSCSVMPNGSIGEFASETAVKNEYGFYNNQAYMGTLGGLPAAFVIKDDNTFEMYVNNMCAGVVPSAYVTPGENSYQTSAFGSITTTDGISVSAINIQYVEGEQVEVPCEFTCQFNLYHEIYTDMPYDIESTFGGGSLVISQTGSVELAGNSVLSTGDVTIDYNYGEYVTHSFELSFNVTTLTAVVTIDGKEIYIDYGSNDYRKIATLRSSTNPYENLEWEMAWTCTNKVWSNTIAKGGTIPTGVDITAKLYKNGRTVEADEEAVIPYPEGDAYTLVLEGAGEMGPLVDVDTFAWYNEAHSNQEALVGSYIDECIIGEGITNVGNGAFMFSTGLKNVTLPTGLTHIEDSTFQNCKSLTNLAMPTSVTSIGANAFCGCANLNNVTIPNSVTSIEEYTFGGCTSLTSITIPRNVANIAYRAFDGCTGLTSITIPSNVTSIGDSAFIDCTGLTSVTIQNSVIGNDMFRGCTGLTSVTIPSTVASVGNSAFLGCTGLTSITIQNSVIGDSMFNGCTGLTSVTIPSSVTSVGESAFYGCTNLTTVNIYSTSSSFTVEYDAFKNIANPSTIYIVPGYGIAAKLYLEYDSDTTTISETLTAN